MTAPKRSLSAGEGSLLEFFSKAPFSLEYEQRRSDLLKALNESYHHHVSNCEIYGQYCARLGKGPTDLFDSVEDIPFLPVQAFKYYAERLRSVSISSIKTSLSSSATNGVPSTILIDQITARRQVQCLANVLSSTLGGTRRTFLVCDVDPMTATNSAFGARSAAVRGFLNLARDSYYALRLTDDGQLTVDMDTITAFQEGVIAVGHPFVVFGFTYVLYNDVIKPMLSLPKVSAGKQGFVCHIGGWKKLEDDAVNRRTFAEGALHAFGVSEERVIDFYGFTEQMGVVYPSVDGEGLRIAPAFSDVIVRNVDTLRPQPDGVPGLLQFVTPLPFSYPGIAVLTDDYGVVVSRDGVLRDGRRGTLFKVLGRAKNVEVRGCGDIMATKVLRNAKALTSSKDTEASNRVLFHGGIKFPLAIALEKIELSSLPKQDISQLVDSVMSARRHLLSYTVDERIEIIAAAAVDWSDQSGALAPLRTQGLSFLQRWCEPSRLRRLMDEGLRGKRGVLDGLLATATPGRYLSAVPRGLCAHWLSGNVPLLGMLALVQCIISGNANILKAASSFSGVLPAILESLNKVAIESFSGRLLKGSDIAATIAVVYFDRDDLISAELLSRSADVRIAWGGREAVETIVNLPKKYDCEDVIFGPKLSFAVIGNENLISPLALKRIARRVATDCSVFDQEGCANPHTIFVESEDTEKVETFCARLALEMQQALVRIPKAPIDGGTASEVISVRLEYELGGKGKIWRSDGTQWTVLFDPDADQLAQPTYSRVVHVRKVRDALTVAKLATTDIQTIGLALNPARRHAFASLAAHNGAVRFPEIGRMTEFDVAWDGIYLVDRSVRWITVGGPFS